MIKRSIVIAKFKTSISLEDEFWTALGEIAEAAGKSTNNVVSEINAARTEGNLSSAVRLFVLSHYRARQV